MAGYSIMMKGSSMTNDTTFNKITSAQVSISPINDLINDT